MAVNQLDGKSRDRIRTHRRTIIAFERIKKGMEGPSLPCGSWRAPASARVTNHKDAASTPSPTVETDKRMHRRWKAYKTVRAPEVLSGLHSTHERR